jgi:sugar phosphate isomerase/epimerase
MISRRRFLGTGAAAAAALAGGARAAKLSSFGVQLYTVRTVINEKTLEVMKAIEAAGYKEIEAVWGGLDQVMAAMKQTSLKPVSVHLDSKIISMGSADELAKAVETVKKYGFAYAVHPYVPPAERGGNEAMKVLAGKLNSAGEKFHAAGIGLCYHNHAFEFDPKDGTTPFQTLLDNTDKKNVGIEMDAFWVSVAGHDPVQVLGKLSGRVPLVHLKDKADGTAVQFNESVPRTAFKEVGKGVIDWAKVLKAAKAAGVKHYFVEQDQTPGDPIASVKESAAYLEKLSF